MFTATKIADFVPEAEFAAGAKKEAERQFTVRKSALAARGIKASSSIEVSNDVVGSVLNLIATKRIDMMVVSTHGVTGWHPLVFGSITEKLVKLARIPVLLIRSAQPPAA